jgi:uncharacterized protein YdiU (UPF0061 family)
MNNKKDILETGWNFDNSYSLLPKLFFKAQNPVPVSSPKLIILNHSLAQHLGLNIQTLKRNDGVAVLSGNRIPLESFPIAQAYTGHQFGYFTMLGDGRALLGPMLREYIISEAMHGLGIPTTRSLAVISTGRA